LVEHAAYRAATVLPADVVESLAEDVRD
jgi:hypothetical protein